MNRFVKKNMILIIVISLSSVAAIALLVWTAIEHSRMSAYINQVNKLREDIGVLVSKKPAPVDENKPRIRQDIETYSKAADAIERAFNDPLLPALEEFIKVVQYKDPEKKANRPISLAEFKTLFFEEWNKVDAANVAQQGITFKVFQQRFPNWRDAMLEFKKLAEKATTEPITDQSVDEVFLTALGVPRTMQGKPELLSRFMTDYRYKLLDMLSAGKITVGNVEAGNFSFTQQDVFQPEEYPQVARNWDIIGDIVSKMVEAKVKSLNGFYKRTVAGEAVGDYQVYNFTFEVEGSLESIRKLVSLLDQSYLKGNRVYVVRAVFLYAVEDQAKLLFMPASAVPGMEGQNGEDGFMPPGMQPPGRPGMPDMRQPGMPGMQQPQFQGRGRGRRGNIQRPMESDRPMTEEEQRAQLEEARKKWLEAEKKKPFYERIGYGNTLVGANSDCQAQITVEYVILNKK